MQKEIRGYWTGKKRPDMSEKLKGHFVSEKTKEQLGNIWRGKHPPTEFKNGHPKPTNAYKFPKGEDNPFWRGGVATTYRRIAQKVFDESGNKRICFKCNSKENICIHHIDENIKNNCVDNLQALCRSCHISHHKKGKSRLGKSRQEIMEIRNEYLSGGITQKSLAEKHNIPYGTIVRIIKGVSCYV